MPSLDQSKGAVTATRSERMSRSSLSRALWLRVARSAGPIVLLIAVVVAWHFSIDLFNISNLVLPRPADVLSALVEGFTSGDYTRHTLITLFETLVGFAIGAGAGLLVGFLVGEFAILRRLLYPYVVAFQAVPKLAIAPLFVIWLGFGMPSKIVITATLAFFPVVANTVTGLAALDDKTHEMMTAFGASRMQILRRARMRVAAPYIFTAFDVAMMLSIIGAIVAEFIGSSSGLGYLIMQAQYRLDVARVFAVLIVLSVMGIVLHWVVEWLHHKIVFWQPQE